MKKIGRVNKEDLFIFDGKEKEYDIHPEMVRLIRENLKDSGKEIMEDIIDASQKYEERTLQLIKEVAKRTGIRFPHLLQSYVEFFLNIAVGAEYYNVKESTLRRIRIEIPVCPKEGRWCNICRDAVEHASYRLSIPAKIEFKRKDSMCIFDIENPEFK